MMIEKNVDPEAAAFVVAHLMRLNGSLRRPSLRARLLSSTILSPVHG